MVNILENTGSIITYSSFEAQVIERLINVVPELEEQLRNIISRIVDLAPKLKDTSFTNPLTNLKTAYNNYMQSYIDMIDFLKTTIRDLIGELRDTVGNGSLF